jgi:hypothetical protein
MLGVINIQSAALKKIRTALAPTANAADLSIERDAVKMAFASR